MAKGEKCPGFQAMVAASQAFRQHLHTCANCRRLILANHDTVLFEALARGPEKFIGECLDDSHSPN